MDWIPYSFHPWLLRCSNAAFDRLLERYPPALKPIYLRILRDQFVIASYGAVGLASVFGLVAVWVSTLLGMAFVAPHRNRAIPSLGRVLRRAIFVWLVTQFGRAFGSFGHIVVRLARFLLRIGSSLPSMLTIALGFTLLPIYGSVVTAPARAAPSYPVVAATPIGQAVTPVPTNQEPTNWPAPTRRPQQRVEPSTAAAQSASTPLLPITQEPTAAPAAQATLVEPQNPAAVASTTAPSAERTPQAPPIVAAPGPQPGEPWQAPTAEIATPISRPIEPPSTTPTLAPAAVTPHPDEQATLTPTATVLLPGATPVGPTMTPTPTSTLPVATPTATPTSTPTSTLPVATPTSTRSPTSTSTPVPDCAGYAQAIYARVGVHQAEQSLCAPDGRVAEVGMQASSVLVLDMGVGAEISDGEGGDFYFYEYKNGPGILLDQMAIAVAPDDGTGRPGPFTTVFVWGDGDPTNNGSLPSIFTEERVEERIAATLLHNGTGIGVDIGRGDGVAYRFVRLTTYPEDAAPGRGKGVEVDAVERSSFRMPSFEPTSTPVPPAAETLLTAKPLGSPSPTPTSTVAQ